MGGNVRVAQMSTTLNRGRLALGTVQFGLDYGIANQAGRVSPKDASIIVQRASAFGFDTLDTAMAYGESESTLGAIGVREWKVVTKLSGLPESCSDVREWVLGQVGDAMERLGVRSLHGLLLHRPAELLETQGKVLYEALESLKARGWVDRIGVSIYDPAELGQFDAGMKFDLIQAPLNILDRRLVTSGWSGRLKRQGVEIHVRSAFLQGLLLMGADRRPSKFSPWTELWRRWDTWLQGTGLTPLQACLAYVLGQAEVDRLVVGVDNPMQLEQIVEAAKATLPSLPDTESLVTPDLINPGRWSTL